MRLDQPAFDPSSAVLASPLAVPTGLLHATLGSSVNASIEGGAGVHHGDSVYARLLPVLVQCFAVVALGFFAGRCGLIRASHVPGLQIVVFNFFLPTLVFRSLALLDLSVVNYRFLGAVAIGKLIVFTASALLVLSVSDHGSGADRRALAGLYAIFCTQSNDFALGYPLIKYLYSDNYPQFADYLYLIAPIQLLLFNPIGFVLMEYNRINRCLCYRCASIHSALSSCTTVAEPASSTGGIAQSAIGNRSTRNEIFSGRQESGRASCARARRLPEDSRNRIAAQQRQSSAHVPEGYANNKSNISIFLKTCAGLLRNPIIIMTVAGVLANLTLGGGNQPLSGKASSILKYILVITEPLAAAFTGCALFLLGLNMVGNYCDQRGSYVPLRSNGHSCIGCNGSQTRACVNQSITSRPSGQSMALTTALLVCGKVLVMPLVLREIVLRLQAGHASFPLSSQTDQRPNVTESNEVYADFSFLYGMLPTAPSVAIFARQFCLPAEAISAGVVVGTLASAPLIFITATMSQISGSDASSYNRLMSKTVAYTSLISLPFCIMALFVLIAKRRSITHSSTVCLLFAQTLAVVAGLMVFFLVPPQSVDAGIHHNCSEDSPCKETASNSKNVLTPTTHQFDSHHSQDSLPPSASFLFYLHTLLSLTAIFASRIYTAVVAVILTLVDRRSLCFVLRIRTALMLAGLFISILLSCVLVGSFFLKISEHEDGSKCKEAIGVEWPLLKVCLGCLSYFNYYSCFSLCGKLNSHQKFSPGLPSGDCRISEAFGSNVSATTVDANAKVQLGSAQATVSLCVLVISSLITLWCIVQHRRLHFSEQRLLAQYEPLIGDDFDERDCQIDGNESSDTSQSFNCFHQSAQCRVAEKATEPVLQDTDVASGCGVVLPIATDQAGFKDGGGPITLSHSTSAYTATSPGAGLRSSVSHRASSSIDIVSADYASVAKEKMCSGCGCDQGPNEALYQAASVHQSQARNPSNVVDVEDLVASSVSLSVRQHEVNELCRKSILGRPSVHQRARKVLSISTGGSIPGALEDNRQQLTSSTSHSCERSTPLRISSRGKSTFVPESDKLSFETANCKPNRTITREETSVVTASPLYCSPSHQCTLEERKECATVLRSYLTELIQPAVEAVETSAVVDLHQRFHHVCLLIILLFSMLFAISVSLWRLLYETPTGVLIELEFLGIVFNYGQGIFTFLVFGADASWKLWSQLFFVPIQTVSEGLLEVLRRCKLSVDNDEPSLIRNAFFWSSIESSMTARRRCEQFRLFHLEQCVSDICGGGGAIQDMQFSAQQLCDWLCMVGLADSRDSAVLYGRNLEAGRVISPLVPETRAERHLFEDNIRLYRFSTVPPCPAFGRIQ